MHRQREMTMPQSDEPSQSCLLIYDGECRMCVTAKQGLERLGAQQPNSAVRMIPYQSAEARRILGSMYRSGRPGVAFLARPNGDIVHGLDAFIQLLPGLKGGWLLAALFRVPFIKPLGRLFYRFIARYRYRLFGSIPLAVPPQISAEPRAHDPLKPHR